MIIDRKTLLAVLLADFFVMFGAVFIMWDRVELARARLPNIPLRETVSQLPEAQPETTQALDPQSQMSAATTESPLTPVIPTADTATDATTTPAAAEPASYAPTRRIRFSYRNSKPLRVEIIGDFNKWQPQAMTRGKNFEWYATFPLRPGEYTYNFIVDGKVIRDPNNPRTASEGRSLLTVKPLTE